MKLHTAAVGATTIPAAIRLVRRMRGGARSALVEADDGRYYVVKFRNNPQGTRVLINEWIGACILRHVNIACPAPAVVRVSHEFIAHYPELSWERNGVSISPEPGHHYGSGYAAADPDTTGVFDFVPDPLLDRVMNVDHFVQCVVVDQWTANADARQAVFLRARLRCQINGAMCHPRRKGFVALMIDQGHLFNGQLWTFHPVRGTYFRPTVYRHVQRLNDFEPTLQAVVGFPDGLLVSAISQMPEEWVEGHRHALSALMDKLLERRARVPELLKSLVTSSEPHMFPAWTPWVS